MLNTTFFSLMPSCFFLSAGVTHLQQRLPAVLEASGRGVSCAGRGRSASREQKPPLGGAPSSRRQERGPRPGWAATGRCADGPVWQDADTNSQESRRETIQAVTQTPPKSCLFFCSSLCSLSSVSGGITEHGGALQWGCIISNADPLYTGYSLAHSWRWLPQPPAIRSCNLI